MHVEVPGLLYLNDAKTLQFTQQALNCMFNI